MEKAFGKKFEEYFKRILAKDYKKTLKLINKEITKHKTADAIQYSYLKLLCLYYMQEGTELENTFNSIKTTILANPNEYLHTLPLITTIIKEIKYEHKFITIYEQLSSNTEDKQILLPFFTLLCSSDNFKKMTEISKKLSKALPIYEYISVVSWYMLAKYTPMAIPGSIKLAEMFAAKLLTGANAFNEDLAHLYVSILTNATKYKEVIAYINQHGNYFNKHPYETNYIVAKMHFLESDIPACLTTHYEVCKANYSSYDGYQCQHENAIHFILLMMSAYKGGPVDILSVATDASVDFKSITSNTIIQVYQFFIKIWNDCKSSEMPNDKNRSQSAILCALTIVHYLLLKGLLQSKEPIMHNYIFEYIALFATRQPLLYDISPFFAHLNEKDRAQLLLRVEGIAIEKIQKALLILKLKALLGLFTPSFNILKENWELYSANKIPNLKIEKGQRNDIDDIVLLADEMAPQTPSMMLSRIIMLSEALSYSPYNYDISIKLCNIYDELLMTSFLENTFSFLNIKGIQLETGAYKLYLHMIRNGMLFTLQNYLEKYDTFTNNNSNEMSDYKHKSLEEGNYTAYEDLFCFEKQIHNSYLHKLIVFFRNIHLLLSTIDNESSEKYNTSITALSQLAIDEAKITKNQNTDSYINRWEPIKPIAEYTSKSNDSDPYNVVSTDQLFSNFFKNTKTHYKLPVFGVYETPYMLQFTIDQISNKETKLTEAMFTNEMHKYIYNTMKMLSQLIELTKQHKISQALIDGMIAQLQSSPKYGASLKEKRQTIVQKIYHLYAMIVIAFRRIDYSDIQKSLKLVVKCVKDCFDLDMKELANYTVEKFENEAEIEAVFKNKEMINTVIGKYHQEIKSNTEQLLTYLKPLQKAINSILK